MDDSNSDNQFTSPANNSSIPQSPPSDESTPITPPAPGQVVGVGYNNASRAASPIPSTTPSQPTAPAGEPPQVVTSQHGGGKKRWLKAFLLLIIVALLAAGGWLAYQKHYKKPVKTPLVAAPKTIPLLKVGVLQANYGGVYPNMTATPTSYLVNAQMFDGLVRYGAGGKLAPDLATSWTNPDDNTWLFSLKKNVKFHDGHTLAASDVKYSVDTLMAANSDFAKAYAGTIASTEVVNDNQVKITTKAPDPTLLNRLAYLFIIDANLPKDQEPSMAGTGPYQIKPNTTPSDTSYQLTAATNYSGIKPLVQALTFGSGADATQLLAAFSKHEYNIAGPIAPADVKQAASAAQFVSKGPTVDFIGFNTVKSGPLQNKLVRQAIQAAINPTTIAQVAGVQATSLSQLIPPTVNGSNPKIAASKQDVAKAKQLLTQAGYPTGLTLRLSVPASSPAATEIVNELKQVGITVTLDPHATAAELQQYVTGGQAEMYLGEYNTQAVLNGLSNYTANLDNANYSNPQVAGLLTQAATTVDTAKRTKLLQDIATAINDDAAVVPLYTVDGVWLMDDNYQLRQALPNASISVYFSGVKLK